MECKRLGVPWEEAWKSSIKAIVWPHETITRQQWRRALLWTKPEWEAAYLGRVTRNAAIFTDFDPDVILAEAA